MRLIGACFAVGWLSLSAGLAGADGLRHSYVVDVQAHVPPFDTIPNRSGLHASLSNDDCDNFRLQNDDNAPPSRNEVFASKSFRYWSTRSLVESILDCLAFCRALDLEEEFPAYPVLSCIGQNGYVPSGWCSERVSCKNGPGPIIGRFLSEAINGDQEW